MIKHLIAIIVLLMFIMIKVFTQSIHFSQPENIPTLLNAAQTGIITSDYRLGSNYRTQYTVNGSEYVTYNIWGDIALNLPFITTGFIGIGGLFFNDNTSNNILNTKSFSGNIAYHHILNDNSLLSLGLNYTYSNTTLSNSNLIFEDQWTGLIYDKNKFSQENFLGTINYSSIGAGLNYTKNFGTENSFIHAGIFMSNINKPTQNLINQNKLISNNLSEIPIRYNIYANHSYEINEFLINKNLGYFCMQGTAFETVAASILKYKVNPNYSNSLISGGLGYRYNSSVIILAGYEQPEFQINFSYDTNYASTKNFNYFSNAIELSAIINLYFFNYDGGKSHNLNQRIQCKF